MRARAFSIVAVLSPINFFYMQPFSAEESNEICRVSMYARLRNGNTRSRNTENGEVQFVLLKTM